MQQQEDSAKRADTEFVRRIVATYLALTSTGTEPHAQRPVSDAKAREILLRLAEKFRKEHSTIFSGNNVASELANAAARETISCHSLRGRRERAKG